MPNQERQNNQNGDYKSFNITIDKKTLVTAEGKNSYKVRLPYQQELFIWLRKDRVQEINEGKALKARIFYNANYHIVNKDNEVVKDIPGSALRLHFTAQKSHQKQSEAPAKETETPKQEQPQTKKETVNIDGHECEKVDEWKSLNYTYVLGNDTENKAWYYAQAEGEAIVGKVTFEYDHKPDREKVESDYADKAAERAVDVHEVLADEIGSPQEKAELQTLSEQSTAAKETVTVPVLKGIKEKCDEKIARLSDKRDKLEMKGDKLNAKLSRHKGFVAACGEIKGVAAPLQFVVNTLATERQMKIQRLENKLGRNAQKLAVNAKKLQKQENRAATVLKVNRFLQNMKSPEGRQENFIKAMNDFRDASVHSTTERFEKTGQKLEKALSAYNTTRYASEKFKLQQKIEKLTDKKDKLREKLVKLNAFDDKLHDLDKMNDKRMDAVINLTVENVAADLNTEYSYKNPAETVVFACDKAIDSVNKEIDKAQSNDNYLKNAEMSIEDDYDSIDGIINNGNKHQEFEKLKEPKQRSGQTTARHMQQKRGFAPFNRAQLKQNAKIIAEKQQNKPAPQKSQSLGQDR